MPALTLDQRSPEWLQARRGLITASVAAAILGIGPNKQLWAFNQITQEPQEPNAFMRWGIEHEQVARQQYEVLSGNLVEQTGFWISSAHSWLGASPDGLIDTDGLLELKCPQEAVAEIPEHHAIQMEVQLIVTDRAWCDYWCWTPRGTFLKRLQRWTADQELKLICALNTFWVEHIQTNTPPPRRRAALAKEIPNV